MSIYKESPIPPFKKKHLYHCSPVGSPWKDHFHTYIKEDVISAIRVSRNQSFTQGFLLGEQNLEGNPPFITISRHYPIKNELNTKLYLRYEEKLTRLPGLSILGWYRCDVNIKKTLPPTESHIHHRDFFAPWQVVLIWTSYRFGGDRQVFFGWRNRNGKSEITMLNGYHIFYETQDNIESRLANPVELSSISKRNTRLESPFRKKKLEIRIQAELFLQIVRFLGAHYKAFSLDEAGGILLGNYNKKKNILDIQQHIPAQETRAGRTNLTFTHETWNKIHEERTAKYPHLSIIGWYHSHPGWGVFLSSRDLFIQKEFFKHPYQVALVVDPVLRKFCFFGWLRGQIVKHDSNIIHPP